MSVFEVGATRFAENKKSLLRDFLFMELLSSPVQNRTGISSSGDLRTIHCTTGPKSMCELIHPHIGLQIYIKKAYHTHTHSGPAQVNIQDLATELGLNNIHAGFGV